MTALDEAVAKERSTQSEPVRSGSRRWHFDGEEIAPGRIAASRLGGGGDYEVYSVWDDQLCAAAAAKLVRPDRVTEAGCLRRLRREALILDSFPHPSLPRIFDVVDEGPTPHVLLELLDGPSLASYLKRFGSIGVDQLLPLAVQVAGFLHFFARNDHVHLDIKPGNVVMTAVPKVIDLSLARSVEAAAGIEGVIGTRPYLSPEQCTAPDGHAVGPPADVWGLGMMMFEALDGRRPFRNVEWKAVPPEEYPQVHEPPRRLPRDLPRRLRDVTMGCLAKHPEHRPTAAEVVVMLEGGIARARQRLR